MATTSVSITLVEGHASPMHLDETLLYQLEIKLEENLAPYVNEEPQRHNLCQIYT
jgi:hypothetical protein